MDTQELAKIMVKLYTVNCPLLDYRSM